MSDFFADHAAERDQWARQLDPEGEADARREAEAAKAALEVYRNGRQRLSGTSTPEEQELSDRAVETCQRFTAIEAANKRARSRIAELDVPLEAPRRMQEATQDLRTKNAALQEAQSNLRDVDRVIAELCSEIAKLEEQDGAQFKAHATTEFAARLANKTAKTPPGIGDLETTLRAMRATLELAQEERAEVAAQVQRCSDEAAVADNVSNKRSAGWSSAARGSSGKSGSNARVAYRSE